VESVSQCKSGVAAKLEAHHAVFQLPAGHPQSDLPDQQRGIAERVTAQDHQNAQRVPYEEAALKLLFLALPQAAKKWTMPIHHWRSLEPLHDSIAGAHVGPGELPNELAASFYRQGKGDSPFPGTASPKPRLGLLHKRIDTSFGRPLGSSCAKHQTLVRSLSRGHTPLSATT
jgi:hypothetical protein